MNKDSYVNPTIQECLDLVDAKGNLILRNYPNLESLPEGLRITGNIEVWCCDKFTTMPSRVTKSSDVCVWECVNLTTLLCTGNWISRL